MKKSQLLVLLLVLANMLPAQRKFEFGFSIKAGAGTITETGSTYNPYWLERTTVRPGISTEFGGYGQIHLNRRWAVSAGLTWAMMQSGSSKFYSDRHWSAPPGTSMVEYTLNRSISIQSLLLPLQVHFSPFSGNRLAFSLGAAAHRILGKRLDSAVQYSPDVVLVPGGFFAVPEDGIGFDSDTHLLLTGGIEFRAQENTTVGLSLTLRPGGAPVASRNLFGGTALTSFPYLAAFNPKNLSVSVRHNVLR